MKGKIYGTALLVSLFSLSYATYALIYKKDNLKQNVEKRVSVASEKPSEKIDFPQDLTGSLTGINLAHSKLDNIKIVNHFTTVYTYSDTKETVEENEFILYRKGKNFICDAGDMKRVQDNKYNILVNENLKMILVFDPDNGMGWYMKEALKNFHPDSSLLLADKAQKLTASKTHKAYAIYYSVMPYSRLDIDYDTISNLLSSVTFYYDNVEPEEDIRRKKVTVSMKYEKLTTASASLFETRKYFSVKKGEFTPTALYNGYAIYNNMKE